MATGTCDCGAVTVSVPELPAKVTDCDCNICRKRGVLWAYFPDAEVQVDGPTTVHLRGPKRIGFHFCATCGCSTHWRSVDGSFKNAAVNARLLDGFDPWRVTRALYHNAGDTVLARCALLND